MIKIYEYGQVSADEIFARSTATQNVSATVKEIIARVQDAGDVALREYAEKFDGAPLTNIEVSKQEIDEAYAQVDEKFLDVIRSSIENITRYHTAQKRNNYLINEEDGVVLGQRITAIDKVGLYVPGGTAAYPSSVLMNALPAKIAGCPYVCMITPPNKEGKVNSNILVAAHMAGVSHIFKSGGAQAIAALAYGTETVPCVDKIVGPGNAFVAEAKRQVFGTVSIDMIAGPSEILVVADATNDARIVAADLLSQAEHDKNASAVLVTTSAELAKNVQAEIEEQLKTLPREGIARASIENNGKIIVIDTLSQAIDIANEIAPEHLELCVDNPFDVLNEVKHAGSIFMGKNCPEAFGDYMAGPNHVLPTGGTAKFSSALSVDDFVKKTQFTYFTNEAATKLVEDVAYFARQEGLEAHARSAESRL